MNWLKENPFISGVVLAAAAGAAALAFLLSGAMGSHQAAADGYTAAVQKLQQLQNRVPFPNQENLAQATALRDKYLDGIGQFKSHLAALQVPIDASVSPQQFQDELRKTVDELVAKARTAGVGLPENFNLGFDAYRASPPSERAAPYLQRQLNFIAGILNGLIGSNPENPGIISIDSLERPLLPQEEPDSAQSPPAQGIGRAPFSLHFSAEQSKFRIAFNNLLRTPQFLIVRSLNIANSHPEGPIIAAAEPANAQPGTADLLNPNNKKKDTGSLNVILGRETLKVQLKIEMVDFHFPPEKAEAPAAK